MKYSELKRSIFQSEGFDILSIGRGQHFDVVTLESANIFDCNNQARKFLLSKSNGGSRAHSDAIHFLKCNDVVEYNFVINAFKNKD